MASKDRKFTGRITQTERMTSSKYGNPRYRVFFEDGLSYPTEPDASVAYGINNPEYRNNDVEVTVNGRGWITYITPIKTGE